MAEYLSQNIRQAGSWSTAVQRCALTYEERFLRRKVLRLQDDSTVLVDLAQTTSLNDGDALELSDGQLIEIVAAEEELLEVTGPDLTRLAWHIGNRHTPCQIDKNRLLIKHDHVIADMLKKIGATVRDVREPFKPEGGAYGHGRTHGHAH